MPFHLKFYRRIGHGPKMFLWFGYNPQIIFVSGFHILSIVVFQDQLLSKCIDSGYLVRATPHTSLPSFLDDTSFK